MNSDLVQKLSRPGYRRAFLRDGVTSWIVYQIRALREQRGWTQGQLGETMGGKPQSRIAQIESADYGRWNLSTLLDLANAFDVALDVRFVRWPDYIRSTNDTSPAAMEVASFDQIQFEDINTPDSSGSTLSYTPFSIGAANMNDIAAGTSSISAARQ